MPPRNRRSHVQPGPAGPAALAPPAEQPTEQQPPVQPTPEATPDPAVEATRTAVASADGMVRALLVERAGLARRGLADRLGQVDEQLQIRGYPTDGMPGVESGDSSN